MAKQRYLTSTKKEGLEFRITGATPTGNPDEFTVKLEGAHGVAFERLINPAILEKYGYQLTIREE